MNDTPRSSIDWGRKLSLPVAVPLDIEELSAGAAAYFTASGVKAAVLTGAVADIAYRNLPGRSYLFPAQSNVAGLVDAAPDPGALQSALSAQYPADGQFYDASDAAMIAEYYATVVAELQHKNSGLLPVPYAPPQSLHLSWPPGSASVHGSLAGSVSGIDPDGGATGFFYARSTSSAEAGEMDPTLVRAAISGLVRFERYHHFELDGAGAVVGRNRSNAGRLVLYDPDLISVTYDTAEGRALKAISGLAYENIDATYAFSGPGTGIITSRPQIARAFKDAFILHLSLFASYLVNLEDPEEPARKEDEPSRITPVLFEYAVGTLTRLLRAWAAYCRFITGAADLTDLDSGQLALLESTDRIEPEALSAITSTLQLTHAEGETGSSWARLLRFMDDVYVPLLLGVSWRELGVDLAKHPAFSNDPSGWWTAPANAWAATSLKLLEVGFLGYVQVYAGCPLASPAAYYKKSAADPDGVAQLETGAGLTVFDVEALTLSGETARLGIGAVAAPAALYAYVDMTPFAPLEVGRHMTLRPYQTDASGNQVRLLTVPYEQFIGELLEDSGTGPVLAMSGDYAGHPLVDGGLATIPDTCHVIARRDDGDTARLETSHLLELSVSFDYALREDYVVDTVLQDLTKLHVKVALTDPVGAEYLYFQAYDAGREAQYRDGAFTHFSRVSAERRTLIDGWTESEAVDYFLAENVFDYEERLLVLVNEAAKRVSVYVWFLARQTADSNPGPMRFSLQLFYDADVLESAVPAAALLDSSVSGTRPFPAVFEETPDPSRVFDIARSTVFNTSTGGTGAGGTFFPQAEYLRQFIWGQGADTTEPAHAIYQRFLNNLPNQAAITASVLADATARGELEMNTSRLDPYLKFTESYATGPRSNGLYNQLLPANVHDHFRIVDYVFSRQTTEFAQHGVPADVVLPIGGTLALWFTESFLNLAPGIPMLRKGIPPAFHHPEQIIVFGGHQPSIRDLIGCSLSLFSFSRAAFDSRSKEALHILRADTTGWFFLNLLSMDAYNGLTGTVTNAATLSQQKNGFIKTVLHTRRQLGMLSAGSAATATDVAVIREGYREWHQIAGNLSVCWGFVPEHGTQMGFVAARNGTELQRLWIYEAAMHFSSMLRGPLLTGYTFQHRLPYVLAYVRFNFGEFDFIYRLKDILLNTYTYAVREHAKPGHGELGTRYAPDVQALLEDMATQHFGVTPADVAAFTFPTNFPGPSDLSEIRRRDTRDAVGAAGGDRFAPIEAALQGRSFSSVEASTYLSSLLLGPAEQSMVDFCTLNLTDMNTLMAWMDADATRWERMGEFFRTPEGKFVVITTSSTPLGSPTPAQATRLSQFEIPRWLHIRMDAYDQMFA